MIDEEGARPGVGNDDARYRLLVDAIHDYAIYMLDPEGVVSSWNPGAERFKGYAAAEILGRHFSCFYTPEDREAGLPATALRIAAEQGRFEREGWRVRKDGSRFWAHVVMDPIRAPGGELVGYAKITRDLTERKLSEDALRRSEQQFRILVQGVTDYAIYLLDVDGRVSSWNTGAERIKGYAPDEILGEHFSRFYTEEDRGAGEPARALTIAEREGRFEREGWRVRKDGSRFWAHVIVDALHDEEGRLIGYAKITRDVTERRETQRALEQAQQALFQAQKMESIGQLTGGVAHDFNNLLMAVLGSLELAKKRLGEADPKVLTLIDNAIQGAQRGASLTRRMLAFARRQELRAEAVDVPALVRGMEGLLERSIGPGVTLTSRFPAGLPPVRTDANQLETALMNLVVNARDAMPNGGRITITAARETLEPGNRHGLPPGPYVALAVTDTGMGMDDQTMMHAMEPFFTTKGVGKGTGLGLSMVHGLAEQSGGRLRLTSQLGRGARVEMLLPAAAEQDQSPSRATPARPGPAPAARRLTVLAVDDDGLVLMNTSAMLEDLGHAVIEAASGAEALQALQNHPEIDLLVSDQAMPGMTGVQLAAAARAVRPELPVILATGYAELPPGSDPALQRLAKPFTQAELAEAVAAARAG